MSDPRAALALAALDPDGALAASPAVVDVAPPPPMVVASGPAVMAIEAAVPQRHQRWRWFMAYWLIRLAARLYGFRVEFYRPPHPWEE